MECMIENKANMESEKCVAGIEYFQLVSADLLLTLTRFQ